MASSTKTVEESGRIVNDRYFLGCRKDANCICEICFGSINATLDLMSPTVRKSYLTRVSQQKSVAHPISPTTKKNERRSGIGCFLKPVMILGLALVLGFWMLEGNLKPQSTKEMVRFVGVRSQAVLELGLFKDGPVLISNSKCVVYKSGMEEMKWSQEGKFRYSRLAAEANGTHRFCS
ncbi:unnamed protein product [Microthlaspi erraticum]|uniref:Uncharacterized protein n=1 Tax=Microthlaspi erraticum TaxID=1685480 RepID=A0A6D2LK63_9BRAS|nr:unnamed protein product [Microthlaspi erraticum]